MDESKIFNSLIMMVEMKLPHRPDYKPTSKASLILKSLIDKFEFADDHEKIITHALYTVDNDEKLQRDVFKGYEMIKDAFHQYDYDINRDPFKEVAV